MKALIMGMALIVMGVVPAIPASAQGSGDPDARRQVGCRRCRRLPACSTFWIIEMQGNSPIAQSSRTVRFSSDPERSGSPQFFDHQVPTFASVLEWNLSHMANLRDKYALGGVGTRALAMASVSPD